MGQLSLVSRDCSLVSRMGWGRERGVTTSSLLGVEPSISRSASVFLFNLSISISICFNKHEHIVVTCACYSCQPQAGANPCSDQPEARRPCTPTILGLGNLWLLFWSSNCTNLVVADLLTRNVATLDTGSLVRTPCFCLITHCQLEKCVSSNRPCITRWRYIHLFSLFTHPKCKITATVSMQLDASDTTILKSRSVPMSLDVLVPWRKLFHEQFIWHANTCSPECMMSMMAVALIFSTSFM